MNQTQMYAHRVWCNGILIASFMADHLADGFIKTRKAQYPSNKYTPYDPAYRGI